jgi:alpha-acetolactate decarboxylase
MQKRTLFFIATTLISFNAAAADTAKNCITAVSSHSDRTKMEAKDYTATVEWKAVDLQPTSVGYGTAGGREHELTIVDGKVYRVRPTDGDALEVKTDTPTDGGAFMLQVATPTAWEESPDKMDAIGSFDDLSFAFDELVDSMGCGEDVVLPFKITGHANKVTWSLDTLPKEKVTESSDEDVTIVGLYNRNDKQKLFMVPGYNLHAHVVLNGKQQAGHIRDLDLAEGATLYLPAAAK